MDTISKKIEEYFGSLIVMRPGKMREYVRETRAKEDRAKEVRLVLEEL